MVPGVIRVDDRHRRIISALTPEEAKAAPTIDDPRNRSMIRRQRGPADPSCWTLQPSRRRSNVSKGITEPHARAATARIQRTSGPPELLPERFESIRTFLKTGTVESGCSIRCEKRSPLESRAIARWRDSPDMELWKETDTGARVRVSANTRHLPVPMADSSSLLPPQSFRVSRMQSWLNLCFTARGKK